MQRHRLAPVTSAMAVSSFIFTHKQSGGNSYPQRDYFGDMTVGSTSALTYFKGSMDDINVRLCVVRRFADLVSRSVNVYVDYQIHETWHTVGRLLLQGIKEKQTSDGMTNSESQTQGTHPWTIVSPHLEGVHQRAAKSLYEACSNHGGVLVKLGQFISINMMGFLPEVYIQALTPLQDSCAPLPFDTVKQIVLSEIWKLKYGPQVKMNLPYDRRQAEELLKSVFRYIEERPIGSASLAQVHKAILDDGTIVAIKVQRPNLDRTTETDLFVLHCVSRALEYFSPGVGFHWLIPEFHQTVVAELDFCQEAANARRCKEMLSTTPLVAKGSLAHLQELLWRNHKGAPRAIIPEIIQDLTTSKLLTMSFEEGIKITDKEAFKKYNIAPSKVAAATCSLFSELMLVHGFLHVDPHFGNILVRPRCTKEGGKTDSGNGEFDLVLLDHGMYRRLNEQFRWAYASLWKSLIIGDTKSATDAVVHMGLQPHYVDLLGLILVYRIPVKLFQGGDFLHWRDYKLGELMGKKAKQEMTEKIKAKYGLGTSSSYGEVLKNMPRDLFFCLRCMNLVRGLNRELGGTTLDRFLAFGASASKGCRKRVDELSIYEAESLLGDEKESFQMASKKQLNLPVASEWARETSSYGEKHLLNDFVRAVYITALVWRQSLFVDLLHRLSGKSVDKSTRRLG